jgi:hypothetical protein
VIASLQDRFDAKYIPEPMSGCWLWVGASAGTKGNPTYGLIKRAGTRKWDWAHRVSCTLHKGGIPEGMSVLHRCDMPCCVNPDHLFFGTQLDNIADCVKKGRNRAASGEGGSNTTLTQAQAIDAKYSSDSERACARRLGVSRGCVTKIRRGNNWKHI